MKKFSAAGTSFQKDNWKSIFKGDACIDQCRITLSPDNENKFDTNAVKVMYEGVQLGFMNRSDALLYRSKFGDKEAEVGGRIVVKGDKRTIEFDVDINDGMNHYVYKITNLLNGCYYIGKRSCLVEIDDDFRYMGSGVELLMAIYEHGKENFKKEIIYRCGSASEAFKKEAKLVTLKEVSDPLCYNLVVGGANGYQRTLNALSELWDEIDVIDYLGFFRELKTMSKCELDSLEKSIQYQSQCTISSDARIPSNEERMSNWDRRFKLELIRLVKGLSTKERIAKIFCKVDIAPFLEAIPD